LPNQFICTSGEALEYGILFFVDPYGRIRLLTHICRTLTTLYRSKIPLRLIKIKGQDKKNAEQINQIIRLIKVIFWKDTMLSVSDKSESVNERTHTDQQRIKFHI